MDQSNAFDAASLVPLVSPDMLTPGHGGLAVPGCGLERRRRPSRFAGVRWRLMADRDGDDPRRPHARP